LHTHEAASVYYRSMFSRSCPLATQGSRLALPKLRMEQLRCPGRGGTARLPVAVLALIQAACTLHGGLGSKQEHLTVSAAASLKETLEEIEPLYRHHTSSTTITYNFGGSGTLEQQVEQGAPVDVFISASPREVEALALKGLLVEESRKDLVKNEVVLVVPRDSKLVIGFGDLMNSDVKRIAIGDPEAVPAGQYAKEVLTHLRIFEGLQPKLILTRDVRQALAYASMGNVDAAVVYETDARVATQVKVVAVAPPGSHEPIVYPVAAVKTQHSPAAAMGFVQFLLGAEAQAVFAKHGFIPAGSGT